MARLRPALLHAAPLAADHPACARLATAHEAADAVVAAKSVGDLCAGVLRLCGPLETLIMGAGKGPSRTTFDGFKAPESSSKKAGGKGKEEPWQKVGPETCNPGGGGCFCAVLRRAVLKKSKLPGSTYRLYATCRCWPAAPPLLRMCPWQCAQQTLYQPSQLQQQAHRTRQARVVRAKTRAANLQPQPLPKQTLPQQQLLVQVLQVQEEQAAGAGAEAGAGGTPPVQQMIRRRNSCRRRAGSRRPGAPS